MGFSYAGLQGMELPLPQLSQLTVRDSVLNFIEQFDAQKLNVDELSDEMVLEWGAIFGCDLIAEDTTKTEDALKEILKIAPEDPSAQKFIPKILGQRKGKLLRITPSGMAIYRRTVKDETYLDIYNDVLEIEKSNTVKISKIPFRNRFFSASRDGKFFSLAEPEHYAVHLFDLAHATQQTFKTLGKSFTQVGGSALTGSEPSMNLFAHTNEPKALLDKGALRLCEFSKDSALLALEQLIDKMPLDYALATFKDEKLLPEIVRDALKNHRIYPDKIKLGVAIDLAQRKNAHLAQLLKETREFFDDNTTQIIVEALSNQLVIVIIENQGAPNSYRFIGYSTTSKSWKSLPTEAESYKFKTRHSLRPSRGDYTIDEKNVVVIPGEQIIKNTAKPVLLYFGPSVTHIDLPPNINITKSKFALSPDGSRLAIFSNEPIITNVIQRPLRIFQIAYDSPEKPVLAMPLEQLFVEMDADASLIWLNQGIILNGTTSKTPLSATAYLQYGSIPESFTFFLRYKVLYDEQRAQELRAFYSVPAKKKKI